MRSVILIVDDFHDSAEALCALLGHQGYPCQTVSAGHEAIAFIRSHSPHQPLLVVLDEAMPNLSGIEVLRALRADPQTAATTVIMHSAGFDVEKRDEAITLGAVAWVMKGGMYDDGVNGVLKTIIHWYQKIGGVSLRLPNSPDSSQSTV